MQTNQPFLSNLSFPFPPCKQGRFVHLLRPSSQSDACLSHCISVPFPKLGRVLLNEGPSQKRYGNIYCPSLFVNWPYGGPNPKLQASRVHFFHIVSAVTNQPSLPYAVFLDTYCRKYWTMVLKGGFGIPAVPPVDHTSARTNRCCLGVEHSKLFLSIHIYQSQ